MKIAFAGTGYISKIHANAARNCGADLTAVVNHRSESMQAFAREFGIPRQYSSVETLLQDGNVDAMVVSTPNFLHMQQTIAALKSGVHVLVEKPMAMNAVEAGQMLDAATGAGAKLMVAHCWRFDEEARWLVSQRQQIGKVIRAKSYGVHVDWGPSGWFTQKQYARGGAMVDMGIHALDTVRFLLGDPKPVSVYARIGTYYGDYDVDDTGVAIVNWETGAVSYLESGWWQPHADGPEAAVQLYGRGGFASLYPTRVEKFKTDRSGVDHLDPGFVFPRQPHAPQEMYDTQMRYFLDCIEKDETPVPGGAEGLVNMQIVDAAYRSAQTGRVIEL